MSHRVQVNRSGQEVVEADHFGALVQEPFAQVTAEETGTSRHHDAGPTHAVRYP